ncbi:MAG: response regulator [Bacteroidota bacterium]|mgnify:FL=1
MEKTILVVDDFGSIRNFLCSTLNKRGYNTLAAENGKEALEKLIENPSGINLVLSDFNMPKMDGMELLKNIKSHAELKDKPVIFLTTESDPKTMREAKELGLSAWVTKPYKLLSFLSQIEYALNNG